MTVYVRKNSGLCLLSFWRGKPEHVGPGFLMEKRTLFKVVLDCSMVFVWEMTKTYWRMEVAKATSDRRLTGNSTTTGQKYGGYVFFVQHPTNLCLKPFFLL